ncbi:hypothetical protein Syun_022918 [Stephania yunnanensis]|uniref:Uncharacterized protein n=1 Tax=Stephania yunnanensis TaxID=152371 RepID=A0AAP0FFZ6_9MAGN
MARSKAVVTKDETGSNPLRDARGRGGRRPQIASYRKEKQKLETKVKTPEASTLSRKGVVEDEDSYITEPRERDLIIARGGSQGEASESSEHSLGNEEIEESSSTSGGGNQRTRVTRGDQGNRGGRGSRGGRGTRPTTNEEDQEKNSSTPLPGGPIDQSLLLSFKHHVAAAIWDNMVRSSSVPPIKSHC